MDTLHIIPVACTLLNICMKESKGGLDFVQVRNGQFNEDFKTLTTSCDMSHHTTTQD